MRELLREFRWAIVGWVAFGLFTWGLFWANENLPPSPAQVRAQQQAADIHAIRIALEARR